MSKAKVITFNEDPQIAEERLRDSCRQQHIEEKKMVCLDGEYRLTEKGRLAVARELERYQLRPGMFILIEQYFADHFGVYLS